MVGCFKADAYVGLLLALIVLLFAVPVLHGRLTVVVSLASCSDSLVISPFR